jgi:hypothetical protein
MVLRGMSDAAASAPRLQMTHLPSPATIRP